jgi:isoleucyl-tRNA synthetase
VLEQRGECSYPADLYLEGTDQHRGWFHSSLLASIGRHRRPPYKAVLTHGYVVDGAGRKMSKSEGNVVAPQTVIAKYGAEILRLWVSSVDYREDIRYSEEIIRRLIDAYRRIRNTCRYLLGNIHDFTPEESLPPGEMDSLDRFALDTALRVHERIQEAYRDFEFHKVFHALHNFCVTDLSAFYLDILKDRLYSQTPASRLRRSAQNALRLILLLLMRDMAPILSFTAEEVFQSLPAACKPDCPTVFALPEPDMEGLALPPPERELWDILLETRAVVTAAIEPLRQEGQVGHSLDTALVLYAENGLLERLATLNTDLRAVFIVSQFELRPLAQAPAEAAAPEGRPGLKISVRKAKGEKCARCWIYSEETGGDAARPGVCPRCAAALKELGL